MIISVYREKSHCGYCNGTNVPIKGEQDASDSMICDGFSVDETQFKVEVEEYEKLLNNGWRRSGCYFYRPVLGLTCCSLTPIRLNVNTFVPSRSQRKSLLKFLQTTSPRKVGKINNIQKDPTRFVDYFLETLFLSDNDKRFRLKFTRPQSSSRKKPLFELYKKYQIAVHGDLPQSITYDRFKRFLCDTALPPLSTTISEEGFMFPNTMGTAHLEYLLDDQLIAVSVLDILPNYVSSVYFFYDPEFAHLSLGTISACLEIAMMRHDISKLQSLPIPPGNSSFSSSFHYYTLGYYLKDCPKMAYKANFGPCELCLPIITKHNDHDNSPIVMQWKPKGQLID